MISELVFDLGVGWGGCGRNQSPTAFNVRGYGNTRCPEQTGQPCCCLRRAAVTGTRGRRRGGRAVSCGRRSADGPVPPPAACAAAARREVRRTGRRPCLRGTGGSLPQSGGRTPRSAE